MTCVFIEPRIPLHYYPDIYARMQSLTSIYKKFLSLLLGLVCISPGFTQTYNLDYLLENLSFTEIRVTTEEGLRNAVDLYHIIQDHKGVYWIGAVNGLHRFNGHSALDMTDYINTRQANPIASEWITALAVDQDNRIWFGTTFGLYVFNQDSSSCTKVNYAPNPTIDQSFIEVLTIRDAFIYVGTREGMYKVELKNHKPVESYLTQGEPTSRDGTTTRIKGIYFSKDNKTIFLTGSSGIYELRDRAIVDLYTNKESDIFPQHFFCHGFMDGQSLVLPTYTNGVITFDTALKKYEFAKWEHKERAPYHALKSAVVINDTLLLVNVERKGVGVYNREDRSYHWLLTEGNILKGFYNLNMDQEGFVWIGTRGRLYKSNLSFLPSNNALSPSIDFTHLFTNGNLVRKLGFNDNQEITLEENQNNIHLMFGTYLPGVDDELSMKYNLDGRDWQSTTSNTDLELFNLSPGRHTIKLAAYSNGISHVERELSIHIYRPLYKHPLFFLTSFLAIAGLFVWDYRRRKNRMIREAQLKSSYEKKLMQLENKALRSQINPHFIFNTLNSIKYYSIAKGPEETSDFINRFSILIRQILENSKKNLIPLAEELETVKNYMEIESLRFESGFHINMDIDDNINTSKYLVPPMIVQPFVENAIWHGLMHSDRDRQLTLQVQRDDRGVVCRVIDNGIGRNASVNQKKNAPHKSSLGMTITKERLDILNERLHMDNSFEIVDLYDKQGNPTGTQVNIYFRSNN